ncbi:MAG: transcription termination factor NusA [Clostridiales bacterium]|uniref:transcription termination factor NusA n=1 Tax=Anaerocaecibacter muris TaxID=2941513 RepID=UPI0020405679|nr:transcription termination factor NusA [Anaerocaecibacter muris]MDE6965910.1 transcription termination factor NusA [Clostridiales bacterium]
MAKKSSTLTLQADFYDALSDLETERGIKKEVFIDALQDALTSAYKKQYGVPKAIKIIMMPEFKKFEIHTCQKVVEQVEERETEISLEDARLIDKKYKVGDEILGPVDAAEFGRIVAQMAKQIVTQKLRAVESEKAYSELSEKEEQLVTCIVHRIDGKNVCVEIQKMEAVLYPKDQLPGDKFKVGDKIKVFVRGIKTTTRGPQVLVTRTAPGFVRKLFELEVPEIASGVVAIKGIVREAGLRTKMAVYATDSGVDAVGACVGNRGARVNSIISEVGGEKIDIIPWHEDPLEYIARALLPAKVVMVEAKEDERVARVVVMDDQLSLAIGREGVNARLAAKLTGWKIDIKPYSAMEQEVKAATERAEQMGSDNFDVFDEDLGELD